MYLDRSLTVLQRNKERLEQFRQIAETRLSVGKGIQQDALKAQGFGLDVDAVEEVWHGVAPIDRPKAAS